MTGGLRRSLAYRTLGAARFPGARRLGDSGGFQAGVSLTSVSPVAWKAQGHRQRTTPEAQTASDTVWVAEGRKRERGDRDKHGTTGMEGGGADGGRGGGAGTGEGEEGWDQHYDRGWIQSSVWALRGLSDVAKHVGMRWGLEAPQKFRKSH